MKIADVEVGQHYAGLDIRLDMDTAERLLDLAQLGEE